MRRIHVLEVSISPLKTVTAIVCTAFSAMIACPGPDQPGGVTRAATVTGTAAMALDHRSLIGHNILSVYDCGHGTRRSHLSWARSGGPGRAAAYAAAPRAGPGPNWQPESRCAASDASG
jgi:hypothetical protein